MLALVTIRDGVDAHSTMTLRRERAYESLGPLSVGRPWGMTASTLVTPRRARDEPGATDDGPRQPTRSTHPSHFAHQRLTHSPGVASESGTVIVVEDDPHIADLIELYLHSAMGTG